MHPAYSVIFFTVASGAGYGLLFLLGLAALVGALPHGFWFGAAAHLVALALVTVGLFSSTLHLGHPERAWRAFSQWRSSWLSREGVLALAVYPAVLLFAAGWLVLDHPGLTALGATATAALAMLTVFATSMIYRSLKPIRQWHNRWVSPTYLALALASGALCLNALLRLFGAAPAWSAILALAATAAALAVKRGYWRFIDRQSGPAGAASATGLGGFGRVRLLEPPHTSENYLQKEMGFRVARRHADKLRRVAVGAGFVLPLALTLAAALLPGALGAAVALLAAKLAFAGLLVERWLFFAEAKHTVTLYYGAEAT